MEISVRKIVFLALLISMGVVLKIFKIPVPILGLTFTGFPPIIAGVIFGPASGFIVGVFSDFLGFIFRPTGPFMPHFMLTAGLTGAIPGLVLYFFKKNDLTFWHYLAAIFAGQTVTSIIMVPYFLNILFGLPFKVKFYEAIITQLQHIPFYAILVNIVVDRIYASGVLKTVQIA